MFPEAEAAIDHRAIEENMRGLQFMTGDSTPAMPAATTPLLKMSALEVPSSPAAAPGRRGRATLQPPGGGGPASERGLPPPCRPFGFSCARRSLLLRGPPGGALRGQLGSSRAALDLRKRPVDPKWCCMIYIYIYVYIMGGP